MKNIVFLIAFFLSGCSVVSHNTSVITDDQMGGLSFDVRPKDAKIFVDDEFVGLAKYFDGQRRRVKILPGEHIIRIEREGFQPIVKHIYTSDTQEHLAYDMAADQTDEGGSGFVIRT